VKAAITGGKFSNGAVTGAFSRLLNDDMWTRAARNSQKKMVPVGKPIAKLSAEFDVGPLTLKGEEIDLITGETSGPSSELELLKIGSLSGKVAVDQKGSISPSIAGELPIVPGSAQTSKASLALSVDQNGVNATVGGCINSACGVLGVNINPVAPITNTQIGVAEWYHARVADIMSVFETGETAH
jgi:hypothetical protein